MKVRKHFARKLVSIFSCCLLLLPVTAMAQGKHYYIAVSGSDNNDGYSPQTAWQHIEKINTVDFKPGDSIFFEGGSTFSGSIQLTSNDNGTTNNPVVFTSYGQGRATIYGGDKDGLLAVNTSFLKLVSLNFKGAGVDSNKGSGIHFYANDSINTPSWIEITGCDVSGFNTYGIAFGANDTLSYKGYRHVRITYCNASENGQAGIASYGSYLGYQHQDFYLAHCKAFGNRGILSKTENHSGNGIVMGMADSLLIEYCEAYENGADNRCTAGGPVGIWVWMCRNAVIQHCISHHNHAGATKDGGGFDIDGGASGCILQYNYSYNNEGAGYLLAEYGALFPFTGNIIRFNVSANDGRKNSYGGISIWGADSAYRVTNSYVYNNTFYSDDKDLVNGTPAAVTFMGPHYRNVVIANNIFVTKGNVNFINSDVALTTSAAYFLHNNYYSYSNRYIFKSGADNFSSLQEWFSENTGQEMAGNKLVCINIDPVFDQSQADNPGMNKFRPKSSLLRKQVFSLPGYMTFPNHEKDTNSKDLTGDKLYPGAFNK